MAARFTAKDSMASTKSTKSHNRGGADVRTSSMKLKGGSTMPGMPGSIVTGANKSRGSAQKGGKSMTMSQGGPGAGSGGIGKRGPSGPFPAQNQGTTAKNAFSGSRGRMERLRGATAGATVTKRGGKGSLMY